MSKLLTPDERIRLPESAEYALSFLRISRKNTFLRIISECASLSVKWTLNGICAFTKMSPNWMCSKNSNRGLIWSKTTRLCARGTMVLQGCAINSGCNYYFQCKQQTGSYRIVQNYLSRTIQTTRKMHLFSQRRFQIATLLCADRVHILYCCAFPFEVSMAELNQVCVAIFTLSVWSHENFYECEFQSVTNCVIIRLYMIIDSFRLSTCGDAFNKSCHNGDAR